MDTACFFGDILGQTVVPPQDPGSTQVVLAQKYSEIVKNSRSSTPNLEKTKKELKARHRTLDELRRRGSSSPVGED